MFESLVSWLKFEKPPPPDIICTRIDEDGKMSTLSVNSDRDAFFEDISARLGTSADQVEYTYIHGFLVLSKSLNYEKYNDIGNTIIGVSKRLRGPVYVARHFIITVNQVQPCTPDDIYQNFKIKMPITTIISQVITKDTEEVTTVLIPAPPPKEEVVVTQTVHETIREVLESIKREKDKPVERIVFDEEEEEASIQPGIRGLPHRRPVKRRQKRQLNEEEEEEEKHVRRSSRIRDKMLKK